MVRGRGDRLGIDDDGWHALQACQRLGLQLPHRGLERLGRIEPAGTAHAGEPEPVVTCPDEPGRVHPQREALDARVAARLEQSTQADADPGRERVGVDVKPAGLREPVAHHRVAFDQLERGAQDRVVELERAGAARARRMSQQSTPIRGVECPGVADAVGEHPGVVSAEHRRRGEPAPEVTGVERARPGAVAAVLPGRVADDRAGIDTGGQLVHGCPARCGQLPLGVALDGFAGGLVDRDPERRVAPPTLAASPLPPVDAGLHQRERCVAQQQMRFDLEAGRHGAARAQPNRSSSITG